MSHFRSLKLHFTAGLAALLLLAQLGAVAHAVKHEADKSDAACALCVFADHLGKALIAPTPSVEPIHGGSGPVLTPAVTTAFGVAAGYLSRAPPSSFVS